MRKAQQLTSNYRRFVQLPWSSNIPGGQRVWFAVYPPSEERNVRAQIPEFELATRDANHDWYVIDVTGVPERYISDHEYREAYFREPEAIASIEDDIRIMVISILRRGLDSSEVSDNTVVAVIGMMSLFGFTHVSPIISSIESAIKGRLLVFFPGVHDMNQYRFMDARDGFNYMAIPITCDEEMVL